MDFEQHIEYLGVDTSQSDFDEFWDNYIEKTINHPVDIQLEKTSYIYGEKEVDKLRFNALDGTEIHCWYIHETQRKNGQVVLTTHGYRSSRRTPSIYLHWLDIGYDVIAIDMRLQAGETGSKTEIFPPFYGEVIAANILDLKNCYLLMMYTDMMVATRVTKKMGYESYVLEGTSQAGGLAVAVGCLMNDAEAILANVPSCSDLDQRINEGTGSFRAFQKIAEGSKLKWDMIQKNISYFDTKNMAKRLSKPLFASVGGLDSVCPSKAFYATYNRITSQKDIVVYPFNGHEGGSFYQTEQEIKYLSSLRKGERYEST